MGKKQEKKTIKDKKDNTASKQHKRQGLLLSNRQVLVVLTLLVFVLYGKSLFNKYSLDDELVAYNNPVVEKGFAGLPEIFTTFYAQTDKMQYGYRPIVKASFAIEYGIFGRHPFVSHLINLLLYILLLYVLFLFLKSIFNRYTPWFALLITLLFMAHPVHAEVVCSLKNRDELLSFLGGITAVYLMLMYASNNKIWYLIAAQMCLLAGFFAKLSTLTFVGIIPLSLYFFTGVPLRKNIIISASTGFILLLLLYLSRLMLPEAIQPFSITENPLFVDHSFSARIITGMSSLLFYLRLLLLPHPLSFFYGYNMFEGVTWGSVEVWLSMAIYLFLAGWALYKIKEKHLLSYAILFYLISISMFANLATPVAGIVGERFAFAATLGFCISVVWIVFFLTKTPLTDAVVKTPSFSSKTYLILGVMLLLYGIKTFNRNSAWKDHKTLFTTDIEHLEWSAKANSLLAGTLFKEAIDDIAVSRNAQKNKAMVDSALIYYQRSVDVYPAYSPSWNNMGSIYFVFYQDYKKAIPYFKKAIESDSNYVEPHFNVGYAYELTGDTSMAITYYLRTLQKDSAYIKAISNLSNIYERQGRTADFLAMNMKIMELVPASDVPYVNISNHYLLSGDTVNAIAYMEKAFEKAPSNTGLINNLIIYYEGKGQTEKVDFYKMKLKETIEKENGK